MKRRMKLSKTGVIVACIVGAHLAAAVLSCLFLQFSDDAKIWQRFLAPVVIIGMFIGVGVVGTTVFLSGFNLLFRGGWIRQRFAGLIPIPARIVGIVLLVLGPAIISGPLLLALKVWTESPIATSEIVLCTVPFPAAFIAGLSMGDSLDRNHPLRRLLKSLRGRLVRRHD